MLAAGSPRTFLDSALTALKSGDDWRSVLDQLPVPLYTTDAQGVVTHSNRACNELVGREPRPGEDQWCVTWKLYSICGDPLPRDECPMARAIREQREIHNEIIIVERPDGRRSACKPYPTPFFDEEGKLEGAVNLILEVTHEQAGELAEQASRCRRLSQATTDQRAAEVLADMARGYAATAAMLNAPD